MAKTLIVTTRDKTFRITIPDDAKTTFGPWSPPREKDMYSSSPAGRAGTLRVYQGSKESGNILAVFSDVIGFRDASIEYEEQVAREEGAVIWKNDKTGYRREEKVNRHESWTNPQLETGDDDDEDTPIDDIKF